MGPEQFQVGAKWVCIGAAGIAFIVAYHKWYTTRHMCGFYDRERVMHAYDILENYGLDYGSSLADSYFHGYLEIILPSGLSNKGFVGRVENYKKEQKLEREVFPTKLFIIVHKNGFSPDTYEEMHPRRFWCRNKMQFEVKGRNGIRRRNYQTPIYQVKSYDENEEITVVMEAAPCLRQLYEAAQRNPAIKLMSDKIISTFMAKIREKIDSDGYCKGLCELIFLDDSPGSQYEGQEGLDWLANKLFELVKLDIKQ